ncbi:MAG: LptA/OstA family protein [Alphaproteobacteria bacterium]
MVRSTILLSAAFLFLCTFPVSVQAQNNTQPLEVTADGSLEWHRSDQKFIAKKNALARQGDVSIAAQTLTAAYTEEGEQNINIQRIDADQNVVITSRDSKAYGDQGFYELQKGYAELTGGNLRLESVDQNVTAKERFEYWVQEGKLLAIGSAKITRLNDQGETNTLEADTITAYLKENAQGERVLDRLEADGNVIITTPTETLTGDQGIYEAVANTAEITGDVTIKRGPNVLEGARASVDLNTSVSRMFGSGGSRGRVKGVFYPGSEKEE